MWPRVPERNREHPLMREQRRYPTVRSTKEPSNLSSQKQLSRVDSSSWSHLSRGSTTRSLSSATTLWLEEKTRPSSPDLAMTWWCVSQLAGQSHLRSAHKGAYDTPLICTTFGSRSFSFAAPYVWNQLPADPTTYNMASARGSFRTSRSGCHSWKRLSITHADDVVKPWQFERTNDEKVLWSVEKCNGWKQVVLLTRAHTGLCNITEHFITSHRVKNSFIP